MKRWKPGDLCRLVDLRHGKVYDDAVISSGGSDYVVVRTGDGKRFGVNLPCSFLQERPSGRTVDAEGSVSP